MVLLEDLDKINQLYQSVANQLTNLNASSMAWTQLNRLSESMEDIAVSLAFFQTQTLSQLLHFRISPTLNFSCVIL